MTTETGIEEMRRERAYAAEHGVLSEACEARLSRDLT